MPKRGKRILWTMSDMKMLRRFAGRKSVKAIARQLKRTEAAIRFKAHRARISLAVN